MIIMFAKLKKKLHDEGIEGIEGDKGASAIGPGLASLLIKKDKLNADLTISTVSLFGKTKDESAINSSFNLNIEDASKDKVSAMLIRQTDECKKLESKLNMTSTRVCELNEQAEKTHTHFMERLKMKNEEIQKMREIVRELEESGRHVSDEKEDESGLKLQISSAWEEVNKLQNQLTTVMSRLDESETLCSQLTAQNDELQRNIAVITASQRGTHKADGLAPSEEINALTHDKSIENEQLPFFNNDLALANKIEEQDNLIKVYREKIEQMEQRLCSSEREHSFDLEEKLRGKSVTCEQLSSELHLSRLNTEQLSERVQQFQKDLKDFKFKLEQSQLASQMTSNELRSTHQENDKLLLRNAELSQQLTTVQQELRSAHGDMDMKLCMLSSQEESITDLSKQIRDLHIHKQNNIGLRSEISNLKQSYLQLEEQFDIKNKMIKVLQQRLADTKKALQQELREKDAPRDDSVTDSPAMRDDSVTDSPARNPSPFTLATFPSILPQPVLQPLAAVYPLQHVTSSLNPNNIPLKLGHFHKAQDKIRMKRSQHPVLDLSEEINFNYLKHVVIKFILSQESEALKLVTAVSALLQLSRDEQNLIQETLEWKMSWYFLQL